MIACPLAWYMPLVVQAVYSGEPFVEALKSQVHAALDKCLPVAQAYLATLKPFLEFLNVDTDLYMQHLAYVADCG